MTTDTRCVLCCPRIEGKHIYTVAHKRMYNRILKMPITIQSTFILFCDKQHIDLYCLFYLVTVAGY